MKRKLLAFLTALAFTFSSAAVLPEGVLDGLGSIEVSAAAQTGTCGDNLTYSFDDTTGTLTISGTGERFGIIKVVEQHHHGVIIMMSKRSSLIKALQALGHMHSTVRALKA